MLSDLHSLNYNRRCTKLMFGASEFLLFCFEMCACVHAHMQKAQFELPKG